MQAAVQTADVSSRHGLATHGRKRRSRWWLIVAIAASLSLAVACSADDSSSVESTSSSGEVSGGMGFPSVAPAPVAPSAPGAMPPGFSQDAARDGNAGGGFAPQEEAGLGPSNTLGRSVIRNGHVDLSVESVEDSFQQVRQIAESTGGYVASSTFTGRELSQRAYLTLRIPAEQFDSVIERLRDIAVEVNTAGTSSQDVTEEYADLRARLRTQQAVEEQYLTLLREAVSIGEILEVQDRLSWTRYEIERVQGRLNMLDSLTNLATLEVTLSPSSDEKVGPDEPGFGDRVREAWEDSLATLAGLGTGVVLALVWGWWIIPLVVIGAAVAWRVLSRLSRTRQTRDRVDTPDAEA